MTDFVTPLFNIPVPPGAKIRTTRDRERIQRGWKRLTNVEWELRRVQPNRTFYPGRPQLNDTKSVIQFINPPTNPRLQSIASNHALVRFSGIDMMARERSKRIADRRPDNYYNIPLAARLGRTNMFGKGPGLAVEKMQPLPMMNEKDERFLVKKVRFIEKTKNILPVRRQATESDYPAVPLAIR